DIWPMYGMGTHEAEDMVEREDQILRAVDRAASTRSGFEHAAAAVESGDFDDRPPDIASDDWAALGDIVPEIPELDGLELGVAGLVMVLSSLDCIPAGSCRGHPKPTAWESFPIVWFVADLQRARLIDEAVGQLPCGLEYTDDLLRVLAASIDDVPNRS